MELSSSHILPLEAVVRAYDAASLEQEGLELCSRPQQWQLGNPGLLAGELGRLKVWDFGGPYLRSLMDQRLRAGGVCLWATP